MNRKEIISLIMEAEVHDTLGLHTLHGSIKLNSTKNQLIGVCSGCNHFIYVTNNEFKTVTKKLMDSISGYEFIRNDDRLAQLTKIYEYKEYLGSSIFAYHWARDILRKPSKVSKRIASLDEIYKFHYSNEIEKRTSAEQVKEFNRLFRKKLDQINSS